MSIEDDDFGRSFLDFSPAPVQPATEDSTEFDLDSRAYLITGGRTGGGKADVKLESMVLAQDDADTRFLSPEQAAIVGVVRDRSMAVAEISARTGLMLGVVQVLVGDLVHDGLLTQSRGAVSIHDDVDLLERMIARVAAL